MSLCLQDGAVFQCTMTLITLDRQRTTQMADANSRDETNEDVVNRRALTADVKAVARRAGFDLVGIAPAVSPQGYGQLVSWLEQGFAGEMQYLPRRASAYEHPSHVMPSVRSVVMLAINYNTDYSDTCPSAFSTMPTGAILMKVWSVSATSPSSLVR